MEKNNNKKNILTFVIVVVLGLSAGLTGGIFAGAYLSENIYNLPFGGEINLPSGSGSNIIISNPKKVVVEQDDKVIETINSLQGSLVGIFKKSAVPESARKNVRQPDIFDLNNFYKIGQEAGEGLIITSDGWLVTNLKLDNLDYAVITQDRKVYAIDKIVSDPLTPFYFIHIQAQDFPARKFAERGEIKNGQLVLAVNWRGEAQLDSILNFSDKGDNFLFHSDALYGDIKLIDKLDKKFSQSFLFNLYGDIVGLARADGEIEPISHFSSAILSLLKNKEIKRPSLGINYIDLSRLINQKKESEGKLQYDKGAIIYKNSDGVAAVKEGAAARAGLRENDIIISVEGVEINKDNNLTDVIGGFLAGDKIDIIYNRQGEEKEVEIILGEIKEIKK